MSHHPEQHIISLAVDADTDAEVIKAFEVLSRVGSSLALDGIEVRLNHYVASDFCECSKCEAEAEAESDNEEDR